MTPFADRVRAVITGLSTGEVVTYGEVAAEAGAPGAARAVGTVLSRSSGHDLPWWRVVNAQGRLAPGKEREQARRLRAEGVAVDGTRVRGVGGTRRVEGASAGASPTRRR